MEENKNSNPADNSSSEATPVENIVSEKQNKMEWPSDQQKDSETKGDSSKEPENKKEEKPKEEPKKESTGGEDQPTSGSKWQTWLTLIGIAIIIIIIALPNNRPDGEIDSGVNTDGETEVSEEGETDGATSTDGSSISAPAGTSTSNMTPVSSGDFTYQFEGISWEFAPDGDKTKVMFKFDKFSRRAGNYVTFGRPFKLGSYTGTCRVADQLAIDKTTEPDTGLGFVQCLKVDGSGTEIGLFQDINDPTMVRAKARTISDKGKTSDFQELFSRDITTIVR